MVHQAEDVHDIQRAYMIRFGSGIAIESTTDHKKPRFTVQLPGGFERRLTLKLCAKLRRIFG